MKMLKSFLALAIIVFAMNAGFSQQTNTTKPDKVSRKKTEKGKPETVKDMQDERGIGQGKPEWTEEKKAGKDALKKDRKKSRKGAAKNGQAHGKKGNMGKAAKQRPTNGTTKPDQTKRRSEKSQDVAQPENLENGEKNQKQRSRKGL